jgi:bacillithiol system protein YtxJ
MDWNVLSEEGELEEIIKKSEITPQVIFKHSIRCSISSVVKNRLERSQMPPGADYYYLDLIRYRNTSNKIAQVFQIHHESPQILVIRNGICVYDESHMGINAAEIEEVVKGD